MQAKIPATDKPTKVRLKIKSFDGATHEGTQTMPQKNALALYEWFCGGCDPDRLKPAGPKKKEA